MILDSLTQSDRYAAMHHGFTEAFAFLRRADLSALEVGRHAIDGERVFALVQRPEARTREAGKLEAHRRYIDVQYLVAGAEQIGWKPTVMCRTPVGAWNDDKDVGLFTDACDAWIAVQPGQFTVFFPDDAHLPLVGSGQLHKVVVKVAVDG
jgi:biofilm protein TabA